LFVVKLKYNRRKRGLQKQINFAISEVVYHAKEYGFPYAVRAMNNGQWMMNYDIVIE
jgi:hypothetical protein